MPKVTLADRGLLEELWNYNVEQNPDEPEWVRWREEYIGYNASGKAKTFALVCDGEAVGEVTLILDPSCKAVLGREMLCDGKTVGNVNALRIREGYRGRGLATLLVGKLEQEAKALGLTALTIGVEACESRNLAIYLRWGYDDFLFSETDCGELVLYYRKKL